MIEVCVRKVKEHLIIMWHLTMVKIPLSEIVEVRLDNTYGREESGAIRIGAPYGTIDRIVIQTKDVVYILSTSNGTAILKKILAWKNEQ